MKIRHEIFLEALRRGEADRIVDSGWPKMMHLQSRIEEKERLVREWQTTFDSIDDVVWILDLDNRIVRFNKAAVRLFEQEIKTILAKHCWEIVHGTRDPIPECPILRMHRSLQRERLNLQLGERWFEVTVDPILDTENNLTGAVHIVSDITKRVHDDGNPLYFITTLVDISERKQTEELLRQSEQRFYNAFHSSPAGLTITRIADGKFVDVNESFLRIFEFTREEVIGNTSTALEMRTTEERKNLILKPFTINQISAIIQSVLNS